MTDTASSLMRLTGFLEASPQGFALPVFEEADVKNNARFLAIPEIEGDHVSSISTFELIEEPDRNSWIDDPRLVVKGDTWIDVFRWRQRCFVGSPMQILAALEDHVDEVRVEAPLTYLDLGLAARAEDTPTASAAALLFLRNLLGSQDGDRTFREVVVRPCVALEIRRSLHDGPARLKFSETVEFDIILAAAGVYHIALHAETLRRIEEGADFASLRLAISRLGDSLGLSIVVLDPQATPQVAPEVVRDAPDFTWTRPRSPGTRPRLLGLAREAAIDLGSNNIRLYQRGRGLVLSEPSFIAFRGFGVSQSVVAVGREAKEMRELTPWDVHVHQPVRDGAIIDLEIAVELLKHFLRQVRAPTRLRRPLDLMLCLPASSTGLERRVLMQAATRAGVDRVRLIESPLAAAVGAGLPIDEAIGSMIVQIGAGMTEIAVVALQGLAYSSSFRAGGDRMDEAIMNYLRRSHAMLIGLRTAEKLKRDLGTAVPPTGQEKRVKIRGRDLVNGLPKEIEVTSSELYEALKGTLATLTEALRIVLENTAPELAEDIIDGGIVLAGGGALLTGLAEAIHNDTGLPVRLAGDPLNCVTRGLALMLEDVRWREKIGIG